MKKIYFLFVGILYINVAAGQIINFPDANLKAKLLQSDVNNNIAMEVNGQSSWYVKLDANSNGEIEVSETINIQQLNVPNANISSLSGLEFFDQLRNLDCSHNQLTTIPTMGSIGNQFTLNCSYNNLTSLDFSVFNTPIDLNCSNNQIATFDFSPMQFYILLNCADNPITALDFSTTTLLASLICYNAPLTSIDLGSNYLMTLGLGNTLLTTVDISSQPYLENFQCENNPNLTSINMKGAIGYYEDTIIDLFDFFYFDNNESLEYVCVSEGRIAQVQDRLNYYGYSNVVLNSYCIFSPGGFYNTVTGTVAFDCGGTNSAAPNIPFTVSQGFQNATVYSNLSGNLIGYVPTGLVTVIPQLPNAYFSITPSNFTYNFGITGETVNNNFCITPNGFHPDLEINLMPLSAAIPGFSPTYNLILQNNGNQPASGTITLSFDDAVMDLTLSTPTISSQVGNVLSWNYNNLMPFESVSINITMHLNSPMDTPPVNGGDVLTFNASISSIGDETPDDNSVVLNQIVVNSMDPNDKTCLEGNIVGPEMIGEYVHYTIRFENTGTYPAQNIVVKDMIDTAKFDVSTLIPLAGSHPFETRISSTNKVEFIFENINLPFDDATNDGYVAFKIKTLPTLVVGDTFSNSASIYFDYNFPIVTNTATTTIQQLGTNDFEFSDYFTLYPNPAKNTLNIKASESVQLKSINIYNTLGQLVLVITDASAISEIDVSDLKTGNYFIKINSDKGSSTARFIKE